MGHTPHLYLPPPWPDDAVPISPTATHHLSKVLRLDHGAIVTYSDGAGRFGNGRLALGHRAPRQSSRPDGSVLRGDEQALPRPAVSITMAAPPPHDKDRLRFMIEKLGELEVQKIAFLRTQYGVGRLPDQSKATVWAIGALEQSRGAWLMEVSPGWTDPGALDSRDVWFADMEAS